MAANLASLNATPTYSLALPFSKLTVKYRPYTVAEQKLLLIAKEEGTPQAMSDAIRQMVKDCTFDKIDTSKVPTFETELLLLNIRGRAVSSTIDLVMECNECNKKSDVKIAIDDIKVVGDIKEDTAIKLKDDLYVIMSYPTATVSAIASSIQQATSEEEQFTASLDLLCSCIKSIVHGDDVYEVADQPKDQLVAFINTLIESQINDMKQFVETCPTVLYEGKHTCPHCKKENETFIGGLDNFFG